MKGAGEQLHLVWRGCAVAPAGAKLNSVAAGNNDDFFTTQMESKSSSWQSEGQAPDLATGLVYRWSKSAGYEIVAGTEGTMLNGIAASSDGNTIYVVYSGEGSLKKIDVNTGTTLAATALSPADNVKWSADGKSLVAASFVGPADSKEFVRCMSTEVEFCPIAFAIIEADPDTLSKLTLFENPNAPMGAGTVGLKVGSTLFIGSFAGNRILQVDLKSPAP